MDLFRWRRTIIRALGPALLCAMLAGWGVYVLTADERPTYRTFALLNTGIMSSRDIGGAYNRDLVINELENIMNLARSFETREELSARLLAKFLSLRKPDAKVISPRAYNDLIVEVDSSLIIRHGHYNDVELIYNSIITERDSLRRFGEEMAEHPLLNLLYGDNELIGAEQLATLRVNRKGMSDLLELSYSTVDAAWVKLTLSTHIDIFLKAHREIKENKRGSALAYFKEATERSRKELNDREESLRKFATRNKIINYYEQTRFIASVKNQVDHRYTEEKMKQAAADSTVSALEERLAKRTDLIRLNNIVDDRRRQLGALSQEQVRLEIMRADSSASADAALEKVNAQIEAIRETLSQEVSDLQMVHNGPEGLELGRLISEWLAASIQEEEANGRIKVLDNRRIDFNKIYTNMADLGATIKKIEREVHIAEEDYLENLRNLNEALQKQYSQGANTDLRLVDEPVLPSKPEKSKRVIMVAVGFLLGGIFPIVLAIALEILSNALLSFAEAEKRSGLQVVGAVPRWSIVQQMLRKRSKSALRATTADLLWQGLRSRREEVDTSDEPQLIVVGSFRPAAGKGFIIDTLAQRLAARDLLVCVVSDRPSQTTVYHGVTHCVVDGLKALGNGYLPHELIDHTIDQWKSYDVVLWELPSLVTGRIPVDIARLSHDALLVHPASAGWNNSHAAALAQFKDALGRNPQMVLNGMPLDVLLNEWGATLKQIRLWEASDHALNQAVPKTSIQLPINSGVSDAELAFGERVSTEAIQVEVTEKQPENLKLEEFEPISSTTFQLPEQPTTPAKFPEAPLVEEHKEAPSTAAQDSVGQPQQASDFDWEDDLAASAKTTQSNDWEDELKDA